MSMRLSMRLFASSQSRLPLLGYCLLEGVAVCRCRTCWRYCLLHFQPHASFAARGQWVRHTRICRYLVCVEICSLCMVVCGHTELVVSSGELATRRGEGGFLPFVSYDGTRCKKSRSAGASSAGDERMPDYRCRHQVRHRRHRHRRCRGVEYWGEIPGPCHCRHCPRRLRIRAGVLFRLPTFDRMRTYAVMWN